MYIFVVMSGNRPCQQPIATGPERQELRLAQNPSLALKQRATIQNSATALGERLDPTPT